MGQVVIIRHNRILVRYQPGTSRAAIYPFSYPVGPVTHVSWLFICEEILFVSLGMPVQTEYCVHPLKHWDRGF